MNICNKNILTTCFLAQPAVKIIAIAAIFHPASQTLSYWALDLLPVDLKGHIQFTETQVSTSPAGRHLLMLRGLIYLSCVKCRGHLPVCVGVWESIECCVLRVRAAHTRLTVAPRTLSAVTNQTPLGCNALDGESSGETFSIGGRTKELPVMV